jgi:Uma2 family endonuclease
MTVATAKPSEPRTRHWTREEFYKLAEDGWFQGQRVLLLEGEIIQMPPMKHPHALGVSKVMNAIRKIFAEDVWVRQDMPLNATEDSDPEPDIAVASEPMEKYRDHPESALLIVEVSDTTLALDRRKAAVYAQANVGEYWIVNIPERQLEIYRSPDPGQRKYREHRVVAQSDWIAPLARPDSSIRVSDLLP